MEKVSSIENFECPNCGSNLCTEENVMDLCDDPFNGISTECPDCKEEVQCSLLVRTYCN